MTHTQPLTVEQLVHADALVEAAHTWADRYAVSPTDGLVLVMKRRRRDLHANWDETSATLPPAWAEAFRLLNAEALAAYNPAATNASVLVECADLVEA